MKKRYDPTSGITLVEVIISMAIVTLVTVAVLAAIAHSVTFTERADNVYTASILAQRRIDVLKKFDFSEIPLIAPETDVSVKVDLDPSTPASYDEYFRTTEITEDYDGDSDLMKIKVSVHTTVDGVKSGNPVIMETLLYDTED